MRKKGQLSPEEVKARGFAALVSLFAGIIITGAKFWAHNLTDSQGVYSDALESIVNVLTAAFSLFVVYYSSRPVDTDHPYGHGKVEYFSSAFEGGLICFAAFFIFVEAVRAALRGPMLHHLTAGTMILLAAGVANLALGLFLKRMGKRYNSPALIASGHHVFSDFVTSAVVIVSLVTMNLIGMFWIDIMVAFAAGVYLAWTGFKLMRESVSGLMDEEDLDLLKKLAVLFEKNISEGIIQIHHTKIIRSGWFHHIDAHVVVPEFWSVEEAHEQIVAFEKRFIDDYPYEGESNFHLDPCQRKYCVVCDYPECPVRVAAFVARRPVLLDDLRSPVEPVT